MHYWVGWKALSLYLPTLFTHWFFCSIPCSCHSFLMKNRVDQLSWRFFPFHSDQDDQNSFHYTIEAPLGVAGLSKNDYFKNLVLIFLYCSALWQFFKFFLNWSQISLVLIQHKIICEGSISGNGFAAVLKFKNTHGSYYCIRVRAKRILKPSLSAH